MDLDLKEAWIRVLKLTPNCVLRVTSGNLHSDSVIFTKARQIHVLLYVRIKYQWFS